MLSPTRGRPPSVQVVERGVFMFLCAPRVVRATFPLTALSPRVLTWQFDFPLEHAGHLCARILSCVVREMSGPFSIHFCAGLPIGPSLAG